LHLACYFIDARGHRLLGDGHYGARYRQDDEPFRGSLQARGHAVRAAYLACGALDVAAETGDRTLLSAAAAQSLRVSGGLMDVTIETGYPLSGTVTLRIISAPEGEFEIALRVPAWAARASGELRREGLPGETARLPAGQLWKTSRVWHPGDVLQLQLPLGPRTVRPHPRIDAVRGCVAFERGPLVYCLEETDAGGAEHMESLRIPAATVPESVTSLLDDEPVVLLQGEFEIAETGDSNTFPYRTEPRDKEPPETAAAKLVPYFAWGNRHPGQAMRVWIPQSLTAGPRRTELP
jgi:hypothetical protein